MKRAIICFLVSILCNFLYAQDSVVVYQGNNTQKFLLSDIDSITHTGNNTMNLYHNQQRAGYSVTTVDSIAIKEGNQNEIEDITITNLIDWNAIHEVKDNYKLLSIQQEIIVPAGTSSVLTPTYRCNIPQIMLLLDSSGEIVMMSKRVFTENDQSNIIDAHSTTIALITMHPIFAFVHGNDYEILIQTITSSQYFYPFEEKVIETIEQGKSLFVDNDDLLLALGTLLEDLTSLENNEEYGALEIIQENARRRAFRRINIADITNIGPFDMELLGDILYIRTHYLTPFYEGVVSTPSGNVPLNIPAGSDVGIVNLLNNWLVPPAGEFGDVTFDFRGRPEGEYTFNFDRTTANARWDFGLRLTADVLDLLGLPLSKAQTIDLVTEILKRAAQDNMAVASWLAGAGVEGDLDPYKAIEILTSSALNFLSSVEGIMFMSRIGIKSSVILFINKASVVLAVYQGIRGGTNTALRITTRIESPEKISYRLCHYNDATSSCKQVKLEIMSGNNQVGHRGERLNELLWVRVRTISDEGVDLDPENTELYQVKFEVLSGGGRVLYGYQGCTYAYAGCADNAWVLGREETEQKVRVCVIDPATKEEISEPVYFTASVSEKTNITFRLDWDRTLTKTDIDLHVQCSKGHHIFYQSMSCPCGGQLDRDDTQGPGPEHIRFSNAEPGEYIVYVHHYESESKALIGWTLTTTTDDRNYQNVGSVPYHSYSQKYRLTISPNTSNSRRRSPEIKFERIEGEIGPMPDLPKKNY